MRSLSVYGLIGAIFGLWAVLMLTSIAMPSYNEYLMLREMYQDITAVAPVASVIAKISGWFSWLVLLLFGWVWFLVAGKLHPALARLPRADGVKRVWAWAAWVVAGLLFLVAMSLMLAVADRSFSFFGLGGGPGFKALVAMLAAALAWLLVSGEALGRFGTQHPARISWAAAGRAAGLGALFAVVIGLVAKAYSLFFGSWLSVVTEALDRAMETSAFGWTMLSVGMIVMLAVASAVILGLLPAFVPGAGDWRARLTATRAAQYLGAGAVVVATAALFLLGGVDVFAERKLADVAGLSDIRPVSLRLVKFCADSNCRAGKDASAGAPLKVGRAVSQAQPMIYSQDPGKVPLSAETVAALERFVAGKGRETMLRKSAMMGAAEVHSLLWQPREMFALLDRFTAQGSMKHGSLLHTQIKLAWLMRAAPVTAETRAMLEDLSDGKRYFIGTRAAAKLAAAWARFGEMERANELLAWARKETPGKFDHVRLERGTMSNGQVSGRIVMQTGASEGVRVGIFRLTDDPTRKESDKEKEKKAKRPGPAFQSTHLSVLADSMVLTADGKFAFQNLSAGDYYLAVQLPDETLKGATALRGDNVPDRISLASATPRRDLGVIRLVAQ